MPRKIPYIAVKYPHGYVCTWEHLPSSMQASHAENETAAWNLPILSTGVMEKNTMPYADIMAYRREYRPLPESRVLSEEQQKTGYLQFHS